MDYKNFLLRSLFSIILLLIYLICLFINFDFVFYLIHIIYFLVFLEILLYFKKYKLLPMIYLLISFIFFEMIEFNKDILYSFNLFVFTIISFDIASYVFGSFFGKNKLFKISPNKTIEGLFGGIVFSLLIGLIVSYYLDLPINIRLIIFIFIIILSSFTGDLIESYFKRRNSLNNSSEFIPGHGGVFDRFDSFLFSIIFYSIFVNI